MIDAVLITGASYGLGRALALEFSRNNIKVYAVARSKHLLKKFDSISSNIKPIVADIATSIGREKLINSIDTQAPLSIIHNAAMLDPCQFNLVSEELLRQHMEVNYLAPLIITKKLLPALSKGQRVLNITSGAANMALSGLLSYCATKAAMQSAINTLNEEMTYFDVFCSNLRPGMMDTPMNEKLRNADLSVLPGQNFYLHAKEANRLISPVKAAKFIYWVLMHTDNEAFHKTGWDIGDIVHHKHWLDGGLY